MKKLLFIVGTLFLALALFACQEDQKTYTYEEVLASIEIGYKETDDINHVSDDLVLPLLSALDKNAKLSWESSNEEIITPLGEVNRPLYDTEVTLILSLRVGSVSRQELYIVTVKGTVQFFTVTFNIDGVESSQTIEENHVVSEPVETPTKENFVFTGWYVGDNLYDFSTPVTSNLTINAGFDPITDAQYVIEFYEERVENETYQRLSNEVLTGSVGQTINLERSKEGFVVNTELSILSGIVSADSPLILKVYFDRITYDVTFIDKDLEEIETASVKYQQTVTPIDAPVVDMYEFVGWYLDQAYTIPFNQASLVTENVTLYAKYEEVTEGDYQIIIYQENLNDDMYQQINQTTYTVEFGTFVTYNESMTGFQINEELSTLEGTLTFGESLVLEVYYERIRYTVQFVDETIVFETTVKYNSTITPIDDLVKEDFEFLGWTRTQNGSNAYNFDSLVTDDVILYAMWLDLNTPVYSGYYASLNGLMDYQIKSQLTQIVTPMKNLSYSSTSYNLDDSDRDPNNPNNVILVYNRASVSGTWDGGSTWNKEHVWPQSKLGSASASDIHNLKPANPSINSSRGNLPFGEGSGTYGKVSGGTQWYPGNQDKGDIARIVLYMNVRWGLTINSSSVGNLDMFLRWHLEDPVDSFESNRNNVLYGVQENRNPFIDHPELVERIWGPITLSNGNSVSLDFYSQEFFVDVHVDTYVLPETKKETLYFFA